MTGEHTDKTSMPQDIIHLSAAETIAALRSWLSQSRNTIGHVHPIVNPDGRVTAVTVFSVDHVAVTLDLPNTDEGRAIAAGLATAWTRFPACIDLKTGKVTPAA